MILLAVLFIISIIITVVMILFYGYEEIFFRCLDLFIFWFVFLRRNLRWLFFPWLLISFYSWLCIRVILRFGWNFLRCFFPIFSFFWLLRIFFLFIEAYSILFIWIISLPRLLLICLLNRAGSLPFVFFRVLLWCM